MSGLFGRNAGGGGGGGPNRKPVPGQGGGGDYERMGGGGGGSPYGRQQPSPYENEKLNFRPSPQSGGLPAGPGPRGRAGSGGGGGGGYDRGAYDRGSAGGYDRSGGGGGGYDRGGGGAYNQGGGGGGGGGGGYDRRNAPPPQQPRQSMGRQQQGMDQRWQLRPAKSPSNEFTFGNIVAVCSNDFPPPANGVDFYIMINDMYVVSAKPYGGMQPGTLSLSDPQRTWANVALTDTVDVRLYDPFSEGSQCYLVSVDAEIGFAGKKQTSEQLDQDELANAFVKNYENQLFAPGQRLLMDYRSYPLLLVIKSVTLGDMAMDKSAPAETLSLPTARGILTRQSQMGFFKDAKSGINLKASKRRPAANSILTPNFKFEDMGIGGLDKEFSAIFRRAFASRIFPPGLIESMGVQHVKGILLYGPPGTGKTLIARKIGQMLNAREPKVINGPEVLNKYVGQSEENIRKLFADAEKEFKEKGEESGLHIIIFDELDAVCKQRGSGAGGGTGVGDSVVNQLLSKLDGVDQLNNILLIGMTNRKDMIDDALLRPGRLEVHMEISLPDEKGRVQILKIHTEKMTKSGTLDPSVDINEIAHLTKNFSGAEISGLVRAATSFALQRHVKVGTMASVADDIETIAVNRDDFDHAMEDVKPAFGVSEDELSDCLVGGVIPYSPFIENILEEGSLLLKQVAAEDSTPLLSAVLHGPPGSGKTALAAKMALDSGYPFIKLCTPNHMVGFNESQKIDHMRRIFDDAYKSRLSVVVLDNVERIVGWNPIGPRFDNSVLQAMIVLLKKSPPRGHRLMVLATTGERSVLQQLDIFTDFDTDIAVPNVESFEELGYIMQHSKAFQDPRRALDQLHQITQSHRVSVGIKKILLGIETAKQDQDMEGRFANVMARAVAQGGVDLGSSGRGARSARRDEEMYD